MTYSAPAPITPPSALMHWPQMKLPAFEARKTATPLDIAEARAEFFRLMAGAWQPAEPYA